MGDLFADYVERQRRTGAADEVFDVDGEVRASYRGVVDALRTMSPDELTGRANALSTAFTNAGVTFSLSGEERPFPLDVVPRIFDADEWQLIERGVGQRVRALEAFLADVYGEGRAFRERALPRRLVTSSEHFHREAHGFSPPGDVRVHVAGIDLVRDRDGTLKVLEDNVRTPSGVSYVLENRRVMARVLPDLFGGERVAPVSSYPSMLLRALRRLTPERVSDPTVVVLTPGAYNSAYFEHSLLARQMGVELVEGRDLICRDARVYLRTTAGEQPVHVIYRRIDDIFLDPLSFRPESVIGAPGLLNAARAGSVTLANAVGNGVADDKLAYTYVPDMVRFYLGEEPLLANVETYRLEDRDQREHVLANLEKLVLKPVDGSGGYGLVIGPSATERQLTKLRKEIASNPRGWIAQPVIPLSTSPTLVNGELMPRHLDLRPFAVHDGDRVTVLPGGLTRVALVAGSLVVNSSQGGGSKDTWVTGSLPAARMRAGVSATEAEPGTNDPPDTDDVGKTGALAVVGPLSVGEVQANPASHSQQQQQQQQQDSGVSEC